MLTPPPPPPGARLCAAGCGTLVHPDRNRRPGRDWWCPAPLCQSERARRTNLRHARKRGRVPRVPVPCEHCGRAAYPIGRPRVGVFCSRRPCQRVYDKRRYAFKKAAAEREGKPC